MSVNVEIERTSKSLYQRDRASAGFLDQKSGLVYQVGGDRAVDDSQRTRKKPCSSRPHLR